MAESDSLLRGSRAARLVIVALATAMIAMVPSGGRAAPGRTKIRVPEGTVGAGNAHAAGSAASGMVRGTVLEYRSFRPSIGRIVVVGGAQTITDVDGRFEIAAPSGAYDLTVVDPNRSWATFYRGLRRRDLLLIHEGDVNFVPKGFETHAAHIDGKLSGGGFDPVSSNTASVYFFSPQLTRDRTLGGQTENARGAAYGPLTLSWIGPESLAGDLVAVRKTRDKADAGVPAQDRKGQVIWWEAHDKVKITSGEVATVDLAFTRLPMGRIAGEVVADPGLEVTGNSVSYRVLPNAGVPLDGDGRDRRPGPFDFPVPDLRKLPGHYCVNAYDGARGVFSFTGKCGVALGATDVTLRLRAPPKLTTIKERGNETISRATEFGWTAFEGGAIYRLAIACGGGPKSPSVSVYTTATSMRWPDLRAVDVSFPEVGTTCQVSVTGFGPYRAMDEAFSPAGIGAPSSDEIYGSRSVAPYVTIAPTGKPVTVKAPR